MDFKNFIMKLPIKQKYISLLLNIINNNSDKYTDRQIESEYKRLGDITIRKYIIWEDIKISYEDFIKIISKKFKLSESQIVTYIAFVEDILDKNTKVGVGYGIIYILLNSINIDRDKKQNNLEDEITFKINLLENIYEKKNKNSNSNNKFFNFLNYVNAKIYLDDALKNNRYTFEDIKEINIEKDMFKDEIVINLEVFLTYLYNNILNLHKDENFILETISKYPGYGIFLIQRIYKKYINSSFVPEKVPDTKFENIVLI